MHLNFSRIVNSLFLSYFNCDAVGEIIVNNLKNSTHFHEMEGGVSPPPNGKGGTLPSKIYAIT